MLNELPELIKVAITPDEVGEFIADLILIQNFLTESLVSCVTTIKVIASGKRYQPILHTLNFIKEGLF